MAEYLNDLLTDLEVLELKPFNHLKRATLARWRCAGKGPSFVKVGDKPLYRREAVEAWLREEEERCERNRRAGELVLQVQSARRDVSGVHRLGGYTTKSQRREGSGSATAH